MANFFQKTLQIILEMRKKMRLIYANVKYKSESMKALKYYSLVY